MKTPRLRACWTSLMHHATIRQLRYLRATENHTALGWEKHLVLVLDQLGVRPQLKLAH